MFQPISVEMMLSKIGMPYFKVIAVFCLCIWIVKKIFVEKRIINNSLIRIIEKVAVGSNESIVIVDLKEIRLVIGVTSKNISILYTLSSVEEKEKDKNKDKENISLVKDISIDSTIKRLTKRLWNKRK
ncbi:MAG: flagellar biosynthetic protein FliO [Buchnera aphidicola (Meitanaphis microgallis)]